MVNDNDLPDSSQLEEKNKDLVSAKIKVPFKYVGYFLLVLICLVVGMVLLWKKNTLPNNQVQKKVTSVQEKLLLEGKAKIEQKYIQDEPKTKQYAKDLKETCFPTETIDLTNYDNRNVKKTYSGLEITYSDILHGVTYPNDNGCSYTQIVLRKPDASKQTITIPTGFTYEVSGHMISPLVYDILKGKKVEFVITYKKTETPNTYTVVKWEPRTFYIL